MRYLIGIPSTSRYGDCNRASSEDDAPVILEIPENKDIVEFMAEYEINQNRAWEEEKDKITAHLLNDSNEFGKGDKLKYDRDYNGKSVEWFAYFEGDQFEMPYDFDTADRLKKEYATMRAQRLDGFRLQHGRDVVEKERLRAEANAASQKALFLKLKAQFEPETS